MTCPSAAETHSEEWGQGRVRGQAVQPERAASKLFMRTGIEVSIAGPVASSCHSPSAPSPSSQADAGSLRLKPPLGAGPR
eukprot:CAMPEP_0172197862 /NCGR_PEP_ID=MMETSP1050-20130122/27741_1 /TAXON_ID=233186 /ORGANISM="Cryptomonas curvata, Strain CCAP979/52" /LENGTH=79 /DNA_ID=CAMNT_0012874567 /DNA_START=52 /DNA_END=287 /DNA_ORIENTATION=-